MYNLIAYKRHLVAVVRKSSLCKCGCHGWCTLHPIWCFVHWSVQAMGRGTFPTGRHDHAPWKPADAERADLQGSLLSFIGMLLQVKGDWLEFVSSLGLTSWSDLECPCMFCKAKKTELNKFRGFSPLSDVFPKVSAADYDAACTVCEQKRTLTRDQYMTVKNRLESNTTKMAPRDEPSSSAFLHWASRSTTVWNQTEPCKMWGPASIRYRLCLLHSRFL